VPAGPVFVFEPLELDPIRHRLSASGEPVAVSDRHLAILSVLVARAGQVISKEVLLQAGWKDVAVGDNSLEQAISSLRRLLGPKSRGLVLANDVSRRRVQRPAECRGGSFKGWLACERALGLQPASAVTALNISVS